MKSWWRDPELKEFSDILDKVVEPVQQKKAAIGFEPMDKGFADLCLTTWLRRLNLEAGNETRTRDNHVGNVRLYQLSYSRQSFRRLTMDPDLVKKIMN